MRDETFKADNNIFTQVSLFVLAGLACKNAILIVEFARDLERRPADRGPPSGGPGAAGSRRANPGPDGNRRRGRSRPKP